MRKQVILLMQTQTYPFGELQNQTPSTSQPSNPTTKTRALVRKIFPIKSLQQRNQILQKIEIIRNLQHPNIIKIQSVLQKQNGIHVLMEYVPYAITAWTNLNEIEKYKGIANSLYDLERCLRAEGIGIQWNIGYLGLTENSLLKYYIKIDSLTFSRKNRPRKFHNKEIDTLLEQLLRIPNNQNKDQNIPQQMYTHLEHTKKRNTKLDTQCSFNSHSVNKSKQSVQAKSSGQRMRVNWREIEQNQEILNDFINVLEDRDQVYQEQNTNTFSSIQRCPSSNHKQIIDHFTEKQIRSQIYYQPKSPEQQSNKTEVLKSKVQASIQRSKKVIQIFKLIAKLR